MKKLQMIEDEVIQLFAFTSPLKVQQVLFNGKRTYAPQKVIKFLKLYNSHFHDKYFNNPFHFEPLSINLAKILGSDELMIWIHSHAIQRKLNNYPNNSHNEFCEVHLTCKRVADGRMDIGGTRVYNATSDVITPNEVEEFEKYLQDYYKTGLTVESVFDLFGTYKAVYEPEILEHEDFVPFLTELKFNHI